MSAKDTVVITAIAAIAISLASSVGSVAFAQDDPAAPLEHQNFEPRDRAPIGARQPRPRDLPPSVLREEGQIAVSQRNIDKRLGICGNC